LKNSGGSRHERGAPASAGPGSSKAARLVTGAVLLGFLAPTACGERGSADSRDSGFRGAELPEPFPAPDFTLYDTGGAEFRFREETNGYLTLLFFGYTHCPDICPIHMANLAAVLGDLLLEQRRQVKVVFVTTDPERDTPEVVREWLDRFDRSFIGLIGDLDTVNEIQASFRLPPAVSQEMPSGEHVVGHASQVVAITSDGLVRVFYPSGVRQADWVQDLPALLDGGTQS
jgi:protein SCO1/2